MTYTPNQNSEYRVKFNFRVDFTNGDIFKALISFSILKARRLLKKN